MYDHILVPTDGSEASLTAAEEAFRLAAGTGATVHVLSVVDESATSLLLSAESMGPLMERLHDEAEENVRRVAEAAPAGVTVKTDVVRGTTVYRGIVGYTSDHAVDLIVMGSTGREGVRGLLGSTTQRVTEHATVPVLVVSGAVDESETEE